MDPQAPYVSVADVGRFVLGLTFVIGGVRHIPVFGMMAELFSRRNVPLPAVSLAAGTAFEIVAGALLAVGVLQQAMALGLIIFTIMASAIVHDFWNKIGEERTMSLFWWQSNLAIIGGLLLAME